MLKQNSSESSEKNTEFIVQVVYTFAWVNLNHDSAEKQTLLFLD